MNNKTLKTVLFIDDEEDIRTIVEFSLQRGGITTFLGSSGREGLLLAQEHLPDLILIDVMLPDMDGPTILKTLRETPATREIPAIFITARTQKHEIDAYKKLGVLEVISKPFDPISFPAQIKALWEAAL